MDARTIRQLLVRDLDTLERELAAYPDDAAVWREAPGVTNVGGTLALHLCGNLRHFVGAVLGGTGYERDRPAEFARRDVPRDVILAEVRAARADVAAALNALDPARLDAPYPLAFGENRLPTGLFLAHLATHLAFHLGQIDYHRRLTTGDATSVGVVAIPDPEAG